MALAMMQFDLYLDNPNSHYFRVRLTIPEPAGPVQRFSLPNWIPGSYMIRDFSRNIVSLSAQFAGEPRTVEKLDKSTWQVETGTQQAALILDYEVYALDLSVRSAYLDNTHAFFNGTSLFFELEDFAGQPVQLNVHSAETLPSGWTVKTSLHPVDIDSQGFGLYRAEDYAELIDSPFEISESLDISFEVMGVPHYLHLTGDFPAGIDTQRLQTDLTRICQQHASMFADALPMTEYRFLTTVVDNGYGGLEHMASTALVCSPDDLPLLSDTEQTAGYRKFLGLCSHEYFHLWNVKRIRPQRFIEQGLKAEVHTQLLWAFEGITSYYDDLALLRSGCISADDYLQLLGENLSRYQRARGRRRQSVTDSSFDAWTKFYKQDENALNAIVSYYTKGAVLALGLDLEMRRVTHNQVCLDDLMRKLWQEFGKPARGVGERDIEARAVALAGPGLEDFFTRYLRTTDELPVADWLSALGVQLSWRPRRGAADQGGFTKASTEEDKPAVSLGCLFKPGSLVIATIYNDSAAERAGLCPGDELVALNSRRLTADALDKRLQRLAHNEITLHLFRRGRLLNVSLKPDQAAADTCELSWADPEYLGADQLVMRNSWQAGLSGQLSKKSEVKKVK